MAGEFAIVDAVPSEPGTKTSDTESSNEGAEGQETHKQNPSSSGLGFLLDEPDDKKVAKFVYKRLWLPQEKAAKNRSAQWEVNAARREGDSYVRLKKHIDEDVYTVYRPKGSENAPPGLNKTDDMCIKVVSQLLVDPPAPECEPASDEEGDRDKAEFSERVLKDIMSESGINGTELSREAMDIGCAYASGFVWPYVDPFGGGWRVKEVMASKAAMTVEQAVMTMDPTTGVQMPQPEPYVIRYVAQDGTSITDDPSQADFGWLPKVKALTLSGENLRFIPQTARDIRSADAVVICWPETLGNLKARYPDTVGSLGSEDLRKLVKFRPERWRKMTAKHVVPDAASEQPELTDKDGKGPPDDSIVFVFYTNYGSTPEYRKGAYVVSVGEDFVLNRQPWVYTVERQGKQHEVPMEVCVSQYRQFYDPKRADPYGRGLVDKVGDGDPLLAIAIGALVEYLPKALSPKTFVPIGSGITAKDMSGPRDTPIPFNGSAGQPVHEKVAPFPPEALELHDRVAAIMDSRSGLNDIAQGSDKTEQSGRSRAQAVEQALVAVSGMKRGLDDGYVRLCRLILQLVKLSYTMPQKLRVVGEDGSYKVKEWTGAELGDTTDVKIQAGTSTMMPLSAKQQMATDEFTLVSPIDPAGALKKYKRVMAGKVDPILSVEDDPLEMEIKRAIGQWKEGPPEGWMPPQPPMDAMGQPLLDPMTGQPVPPPPDPTNPFVRLPHHLEQDVAMARHDKLRDAMASVSFEKWPPEWQASLVNEYNEMRQAAGISTVQEQQQAAAQQQQMAVEQQQQMQASQQNADAESQQSAQGAEAQAKAQEQSAQQQQQESNQQHRENLEAIKATAAMQTAAMKQSTGQTK